MDNFDVIVKNIESVPDPPLPGEGDPPPPTVTGAGLDGTVNFVPPGKEVLNPPPPPPPPYPLPPAPPPATTK